MARIDPAQPLVHPLPDPKRVELRPDLVYAHTGGRELAMDVYLPTGRAPREAGTGGTARPWRGRPGPAPRGARLGQYTGWGRVLAAEGMARVAFEHRAIAEAGFEAVVAEVGDALAAIREGASDLGVDPAR